MREPLDLWLYGTHVAVVREHNDRIAMDWTPDALGRWGPGSRTLSALLPVGDPVNSVRARVFLDGLLPEGNARTNHAFEAGVAEDDTFGLVRAYGRDTPGAAVFVPAGFGDPSSAGRYVPISRDELAKRISGADRHSPAPIEGRDSESSTLAGMVPKITVHRDGDQWFACKEGAASTWIVKRSATGSDVVDTEVASLALARTLGITTVDAEVIDFGDGLRAIAVSRYDRKAGKRIHQEDLAQSIGLSTRDPNRKFQRGSKMPSLRHAANVLRLDGGDQDDLIRLVTLSHLIGNTDMHAKNISFLRHPDGRVRLTPAYDIAMHLHLPRGTEPVSALDVNGKYFIEDITLDDIVAEASGWGLPEKRATRVVAATAEELFDALKQIDRDHHPGVPDAAWDIVNERAWRAADPVTRAIANGGVEASREGEVIVRGHDNSGKPVRPHTRRGPRRKG